MNTGLQVYAVEDRARQFVPVAVDVLRQTGAYAYSRIAIIAAWAWVFRRNQNKIDWIFSAFMGSGKADCPVF